MSKPNKAHKEKKESPVAATPPVKKDYSALIKILSWAVFIIYIACELYGLTIHEPWRDEAQAWLLTKNASIPEIFKTLPTEGHPPLWYLLLLPLAKTGMPYFSQNILSVVIITTAVYILLFKTRIHPLLRLLLPFTYFFFYEYSLFARNYCLITFFIVSIISLYPVRFEKKFLFALCVIGLFNTHVLAFSFCFTLICLYVLDAYQQKKLDKSIMLSVALMLVGGLYLIPYLSDNEMVVFFKYLTKHDHATNVVSALSGGLLITEGSGIAIVVFTTLCVPLIFTSRALILLIGWLAGVIYIVAYSYNCSIRHYGIIFLLMVATYAIASYYRESKKTQENGFDFIKYGYFLLIGIACVQVYAGGTYYLNDKEKQYSGAKNAADFIKAKHIDQKLIVAHGPQEATAILPYLSDGYQFYYSYSHRYGSYFKYDSSFTNLSWGKKVDFALKLAHDDFPDSTQRLVFVLTETVLPSNERFLDLLYKTTGPVIRKEESYYIYKVKDGVK